MASATDGAAVRTSLATGMPPELAQVAGDEPAAVLLVDLADRSVVYANVVAEQLVPGVRLPVGIEAWSDAAALLDLDGNELSDTSHPLTQVARSVPVAGQAVSAARATDLGRRREPMWVVGLPMSGAPQLEGHALVVFLPLRAREAAEAAATAAHAQAELRERAVLATGMSFTVADARAEDMPLIWVNPAFTATTGYSFEEAVGRNCRFLQGDATDPAAPR
ncbi:PAS domain-containing protein, partial [Motilibacter deserti]|nr:histidine kinase [Motilibacter deserti]